MLQRKLLILSLGKTMMFMFFNIKNSYILFKSFLSEQENEVFVLSLKFKTTFGVLPVVIDIVTLSISLMKWVFIEFLNTCFIITVSSEMSII